MKIMRNVRGTKDLFREEIKSHERIIDIASSLSKHYGYEKVATPIFEYAEIFDRSLGNTSDVISKEIYAFPDKSRSLLALRPEFTASIIRAYITNGWQQYLPLKLFSCGPAFRYDRPQAGRQRQFHQLNFEHLGANNAFSDAEMLKFADHLAANLGIRQDLTLELNSLGCFESRKDYQQILFEYFSKFVNDLSEDSTKRLKTNPLRILDSKDLNDKKISIDAPKMDNSYTKEARRYFDEVQNYLTKFGVHYKLNKHLVRGLDYYCHTTFEFTTDKLRSQNTVIAGGRYDGLSSMLGGPDTKAIGFASGIERIALLSNFKTQSTRQVIIITLEEKVIDYAIKLLNLLRENNIDSALELDGNVDKRLKRANKANAKYAIFIGNDEMQNNNYKIKNLDTRFEEVQPMIKLLDIISQK